MQTALLWRESVLRSVSTLKSLFGHVDSLVWLDDTLSKKSAFFAEAIIESMGSWTSVKRVLAVVPFRQTFGAHVLQANMALTSRPPTDCHVGNY